MIIKYIISYILIIRDWRDGYQTYENQTEDISARHYKKLYGHMHLGRKRCQSKV